MSVCLAVISFIFVLYLVYDFSNNNPIFDAFQCVNVKSETKYRNSLKQYQRIFQHANKCANEAETLV